MAFFGDLGLAELLSERVSSIKRRVKSFAGKEEIKIDDKVPEPFVPLKQILMKLHGDSSAFS